MWLELIAMVAAGAGVAGIFMALRYFSKGRMPKWSVPAAIGAGMIAFSIWNEYSWFPRVTAVLPPEVTVISAPSEKQAWRPWTYLFPLKTRFLAFDGSSVKTSETTPTLRQADLLVITRWGATQRIPMAFDCAKSTQATLIDGAALAADGTLSGAIWQPAATDDAIQPLACKEM